MLSYILQRIAIFIPTLFVISLAAFALSKMAPGDPVDLLLKGQSGESGQKDLKSSESTYREKAEQLGLDLPVFYFGLSSAAFPDTMYKIVKQSDRQTLNNLTAQYGNWPATAEYYKTIKAFEGNIYADTHNDSLAELTKRKLRIAIKDFYLSHEEHKINAQIANMEKILQTDTILYTTLQPSFQTLTGAYSNLKNNPKPMQLLIPSVKWYGFNNQYHRWISNFLRGDFGQSYLDSRPVANKMWDALRWTLILNIISIAIAYLLSIPLGVITAVKKDTPFDRISTTILFILYSLPSFWIGTLLIVFFTTPEYGNWLDWFPPGGITDLPPDSPFWPRALDIIYHLTLPIMCITYGSLAFISRQMRGGMLNVIRQDYIRTARAKGLPENKVIWRHAFRNSLFPIITLFASIFPAAIAGSTVIEVIYSIPGMGNLAYSSIVARDWPVVFTILMFAAILTMLGNLVADILYAVADPRVSYNKK